MTVNHLAKPRGVRLTQLPLYMVSVAQLVEQMIVVHQVAGSYPVRHPNWICGGIGIRATLRMLILGV